MAAGRGACSRSSVRSALSPGEERADRVRSAAWAPVLDETHVADVRDPPPSSGPCARAQRLVRGRRVRPASRARLQRRDGPLRRHRELKSPEDTMSSESAVNLDQGDPLAEADFHMAYGLYDQAADLVRIALEREPDRRDLRLKLLEIYFVWGNKDAFLQTAKSWRHARSCSGRRVGQDRHHGQADLPRRTLVRVEHRQRPRRRRFGRSESRGRRESRRHRSVRRTRRRAQHPGSHPRQRADDNAATGESPGLHARHRIWTLRWTRPERGADESPTREMPQRDEPTVETELMNFADSPTAESPALKTAEMRTGGIPIGSPRSLRGKGGPNRRGIDRRPGARSRSSGTNRGAVGQQHRDRSRKPIIRPMRRPWWPASTTGRGA